MAIRNSSDPAIGAIMQNLARLFAPTSPQDLAAYAATAKAKQEAEIARAGEQRLADLYAGAAGDPDAVKRAMDFLAVNGATWNGLSNPAPAPAAVAAPVI